MSVALGKAMISDRIQTAQTTKDKTDRLDLTKSKTSAQQLKKHFYGNLKPSHQMEENICNINFDKGPLFFFELCMWNSITQ